MQTIIRAMQTIIEVRPHRGGWQSFEVPGVEPYFQEKHQALDYAIERMRSRSGEIRVFNEAGELAKMIPFVPGPGRPTFRSTAARDNFLALW